MTGSLYTSLKCIECDKQYDTETLQSYCKDCNQPLEASYHLKKYSPESMIDFHEKSLWRYKKLLPIMSDDFIISLGEGWTPIKELQKITKSLGLKNVLLMKDEAYNPTGSFKARGMSVAVSKAKELGVKMCFNLI